MTTRIAIIRRTQDGVTVAFYHDTGGKSISKAAFTPAVAGLDQTQITALQNGSMVETVRSFPFSGMALAEFQPLLEQYWADYQTVILKENNLNFDIVGRAWDGSKWA